MIKTFKIFKKNKGVQIPRTFGIVVAFLIFLFLLEQFENSLDQEISDLLKTFVIVSFIIAILFFLFESFFSYEKLNGRFSGTLTLQNDKIIVGNKEFKINDIKDISLSGSDYVGRSIRRIQPTLDSNKSNGTNNFIEIKLKNGNIIKSQFQIENKGDLLSTQDTLINYYRKGKIPFLRLINILEITDYDEIQKFKENLKIQNRELRLVVFSNFGQDENIIAEKVTGEIIKTTMNSINWNEFHIVQLEDLNNNILHVSGSLGEDGLASTFTKDDYHILMVQPIKSVKQMTQILLDFFEGENNWRSKYHYK